jgi:hypothetical protein
MHKAAIRNILLFVTVSGILSAVPLFPVKDSFIPMAFAYPTLIWNLLNWNLESYFEGYFAHSIAVIISHLSMSLALTLYILKRITKHSMRSQQGKEHEESQ